MTGTTRVARKVAMVGAAALLALAAIAPVGASAAVSYATVYTHVGFSPEANSVEFWQTKYSTTCTKVDEPGGETYTLTVAYSYVITKAGSDEQYANTVFKDPAIGKTVFADTNGDGDYDGAPDDKGISHIIFCGPKATPTGGAEIGRAHV